MYSYVANAVNAINKSRQPYGDPAQMYTDNEQYEVRTDGQKCVCMLTFAFYASWVQIAQLAAKKTIVSERRNQSQFKLAQEKWAKKTWRRAVEQELFGGSQSPQLLQATLRNEGGIDIVKYMLPELNPLSSSSMLDDRDRTTGRIGIRIGITGITL